jgi:glycosyltransferase involved in cell wall biosynthesis
MFKGDDKITLASKEFKAKKALFSVHHNIHFLSPSKWLADCAQASGLAKDKTIIHIPNVVNERLFKPIDKKNAKELFNLNINSKTIAFGCLAGRDNKFKGWEYLERALDIIYCTNKELKIDLLVFGSDYDQETVDAVRYPVKFLGRINDEVSMVMINNATDVFVSPSLAESFGLSFLENILCNTPVVGFNVGGVPEIVLHKINGYLADYKSAEDLANGILYCLNNKLRLPKPDYYYTDVTIKRHKDFLQKIVAEN